MAFVGNDCMTIVKHMPLMTRKCFYILSFMSIVITLANSLQRLLKKQTQGEIIYFKQYSFKEVNP